MRRGKRILFVLMVLGMVLGATRLVPGESQNAEPAVYYQEVLIRSGDTLWSLAEAYNRSSMSTKDYVAYIMEFNHMGSEFLREGMHLVIPVVS